MSSVDPPRHIFLIGFMAAGKSTVGARLARLLGWPFVDLDRRIEAAAGVTVAALFASRGEPHFRALEAQALRDVVAESPSVVATGGGAPCHGDNLEVMRENGLVIALTAPLAELCARVTDVATRPLLDRPMAEVAALLRARQPYYRRAHARVATSGQTPARIAERVADIAVHYRGIARDLQSRAHLVALSARTYPLLVADGVLDRVGALTRRALGERCQRVAVISDDNVGPLYGARVSQSLTAAGFAVTWAQVAAGERSKSFAQLARLAQELASAGLDRQSAIVALGGGVVGDLAGFIAATLYRGIACIQVPTSLLAMIDSSIGGKTGINIAAGKNLVGAFWQPRAVLADPTVLATLPAREYRAAFGELLKYGLLAGESLYAAIDELAPRFADAPDERRPDRPADQSADQSASTGRAALTRLIGRCAADKGWIVTGDEREQTGERALLNLGHTVGHAIEAAAGFGQVLHGEAVALGLIAACRVAAHLDPAARPLEARVAATLERAGLSTDLDPWLREDVLARIRVDKKRTGGSVGFIVPQAVGDCARIALPIDKLSRILRTRLTV